jgi:hypothetical protein
VYSRGNATVPEGEAFPGSPATPGNLLIGEIVKMSTEQGSFLRLLIKPAARTNSLQTVTVYVP